MTAVSADQVLAPRVGGPVGGRPFAAAKADGGGWRSDPRVRAVVWRDLTHLSTLQTAVELILSLPWLIIEIAGFALGWPLLAIPAAFFFFLTGLRQVHGGFHRALGLGPRATNAFLFVQSVLMLGSMRAVKFNHLRHHQFCLGPDDVEGMSARLTGWRAIALGPRFPILLHRQALAHAEARERRWILSELGANVVMIIGATTLLLARISAAPAEHVALMAVAQCLTAFFAVWTVHHDRDESSFARTQRGFIKNLVSYDMFYHLEHHLFPRVPQRNLPALAARLDQAAPDLTRRNVY